MHAYKKLQILTSNKTCNLFLLYKESTNKNFKNINNL